MLKMNFNHSVDMVPWWLRDTIRKIPLLAGLQRYVFNKYYSGRQFVYKISAGPAKGLNFPITLPEDKLMWTGTWEKEVSECIRLNVRPGCVSYDIGSHRGFMAGIMSLAGSKHVYCFEPNPENISHLSELASINEQLNMTVMEYAIADREGQAEFSVMAESSMGKLSISSFQSEVSQERNISVDVKSLDILLENGEIEAPGFIKIDVEGAEFLVLMGAQSIINSYSPTFVIELHSHSLAHRCRSFLINLNYHTQIIQKNIDLNNESAFQVCHLLAVR